MRSDRIAHPRSMLDQHSSGPVQHQHALLINCFHLREPYVRVGDRFADSFGICFIVLLELHVGLHVCRRRFGYRRLHLLLRRDGFTVNHKKLFRIYREECLVVRKRGGRKRALGTRAPAAVPQGRNQRWSLDFVSDTFADGRRFRILAIVDDFTRECLTLVADTSLSGHRVARELEALIAQRGRPGMVISDNGTELTSVAILRWSRKRASPGTTLHRANRCRTASSKASTVALRDELLNETMFRSLAHARDVLSDWRDDYNGQRPHTSLNGLTPNEFARRSTSNHNQNGLQLWASTFRRQGQ